MDANGGILGLARVRPHNGHRPGYHRLMRRLSRADRREAAAILRRVTALIDSGELLAPEWYRAHLAGLIAGLDA